MIGFMGSGKSHIGQQLADSLHYKFIDLDVRIEENEAKSISNIFAEHGESYFRKLEASLLRSVLEKSPIVIATGGGTPCYHDNMAFLLQNCICFYLNPSLKLLLSRLNNQKHARPLLSKATTITELEHLIKLLLNKRKEYYNQSDYTIEFDEDSQNEVFNKIQLLI